MAASNSSRLVIPVVASVLLAVRSLVRSRAALHLEILALRHQLHVLKRSRRPRVRLTATDRLLWVWLSRMWNDWRPALVLVQPDTVVAWHRRGFRLFWTWKSRRRTGRPSVPPDVPALIRSMAGLLRLDCCSSADDRPPIEAASRRIGYHSTSGLEDLRVILIVNRGPGHTDAA